MNRLERLLQTWLGVEPPGPGQDFWWNPRLPGAWPSWFTLLFLAAAAFYFFTLYRREGTAASSRYKLLLTCLRWGLVVLLLLMLFELEVMVDRRALPYLVVLLDDSASMTVGDQYADAANETAAKALTRSAGLTETRRLDLQKALLLDRDATLLNRLVRDHRLRVYQVAQSTRRLGECDTLAELPALLQKIRDLSATGAESRLGAAVRDILTELAGAPPAAILYFTDGVNTDGEPLSEVATHAAQKGVPLYTIGLGDSRPARDVELHDLLVDDVVFVNDVVNFDLKVTARGVQTGSATLRLRLKEQDATLASQDVELARAASPLSVRLQYRPTRSGDLTFVVELAPIEREFKTENNRVERQISVREEKLRVLYVESYPRFEFRFVKHLLERDPTVQLQTLLLEADAQHTEQDKTALSHFPTSKDDLRRYDTILFGDVNPLYLNEAQMRNLADFVLEKGGGLVLIAGSRYMPAAFRDTPLDPVIPIAISAGVPGAPTREPFQLNFTIEGRSNPIFQFGTTELESEQAWRSLPGQYWFFEAPERKPAAVPLAVHPTRSGSQGPLPLVLMQYSGAGKVIMLLFDSTWRWRDRVTDSYFAQFWIQTIRYLSRSRLIGQSRQAELNTDRREYLRGQAVDLRLRVFDESLVPSADEPVTVSVQREDGHEERITLRQTRSGDPTFEGRISSPGEGQYRVSLVSPPVQGASPNASFRVTAPPSEFRRVEMDMVALKQLAAKTNGKFYTIREAGDLARDIPPGRKIPLDTDPPISLWNTWPMLTLFLVILVVEWLLRKRARML